MLQRTKLRGGFRSSQAGDSEKQHRRGTSEPPKDGIYPLNAATQTLRLPRSCTHARTHTRQMSEFIRSLFHLGLKRWAGSLAVHLLHSGGRVSPRRNTQSGKKKKKALSLASDAGERLSFKVLLSSSGCSTPPISTSTPLLMQQVQREVSRLFRPYVQQVCFSGEKVSGVGEEWSERPRPHQIIAACLGLQRFVQPLAFN